MTFAKDEDSTDDEEESRVRRPASWKKRKGRKEAAGGGGGNATNTTRGGGGGSEDTSSESLPPPPLPLPTTTSEDTEAEQQAKSEEPPRTKPDLPPRGARKFHSDIGPTRCVSGGGGDGGGGVSGREMDVTFTREKLGLVLSYKGRHVVVESVHPGGQAEQLGLVAGMALLRVRGVPVTSETASDALHKAETPFCATFKTSSPSGLKRESTSGSATSAGLNALSTLTSLSFFSLSLSLSPRVRTDLTVRCLSVSRRDVFCLSCLRFVWKEGSVFFFVILFFAHTRTPNPNFSPNP
jgi:hypothetical protein